MRKQRGFTLLELLTTIAIAAILLTVAIPDFSHLIHYNRAVARVNSLVRALNFARFSASSRDRYVTVCRSSDGQQCSDTAGWKDGWLVFVNLDRDSPAQVDPGEPILHVHGPLGGDDQVFSNRKTFTFRPLGTRSTNGTLLYCSQGHADDQALIINVVGRLRLEDPANLTNGMSCPSG